MSNATNTKMKGKSCAPLKDVLVRFPNGPYVLTACEDGLHSVKQISDTVYHKAETSGTTTAFDLFSKADTSCTDCPYPYMVYTIDWFQKYFQDPEQAPKVLPRLCSLVGTPFRREIWNNLALSVNTGSVTTYKQLAESSGHPRI